MNSIQIIFFLTNLQLSFLFFTTILSDEKAILPKLSSIKEIIFLSSNDSLLPISPERIIF